MGRDTCKYPACDESARDYQQGEVSSREARFCSTRHEIKFDHIKADAMDAIAADRAERQRSAKRRGHQRP